MGWPWASGGAGRRGCDGARHSRQEFTRLTNPNDVLEYVKKCTVDNAAPKGRPVSRSEGQWGMARSAEDDAVWREGTARVLEQVSIQASQDRFGIIIIINNNIISNSVINIILILVLALGLRLALVLVLALLDLKPIGSKFALRPL
eukprot:6751435-Pyramimonas_sp.AAC.1